MKLDKWIESFLEKKKQKLSTHNWESWLFGWNHFPLIPFPWKFLAAEKLRISWETSNFRISWETYQTSREGKTQYLAEIKFPQISQEVKRKYKLLLIFLIHYFTIHYYSKKKVFSASSICRSAKKKSSKQPAAVVIQNLHRWTLNKSSELWAFGHK